MLKISTKGRYGLRSMIELANHYDKGPVLREVVAQNQNISKEYIHNIFTILRNAGLVLSVRGQHGGFILAKHPSKIHILEILEILEGPLAPVDCLKNKKICKRSSKCMTINFWSDLSKSVSDFLGSMTLEGFIKKYGKKI